MNRLASLCTAVVALLASAAVIAQSDRPLRIVLPVATGSGVDAITRASQATLSRVLGGRPVVIENQPGAGGIVGTTTLIRSAPDGNTISVVSNNHVIYPSVYKSLPFDPIADITPIAVVGSTPILLVTNAKVPAMNSRELVALLKAKPDELNYGSSGNGTILHLAAELFLDEAGVRASHVPYKGVGPMLTDVIGGQVQFVTAALPSVQSHLKAGTLRAIGVTAPQRSAAAPDVPTFVEQGLPGYVVEAWFAFIGPKGLSADELKRLHDAVTATFTAPEMKEIMAKQGSTINLMSSVASTDFFKSELAKYAKLVKKAGLTLQ
jgi:tripartite-type tricarboxylate transporter receptor subunit TctC